MRMFCFVVAMFASLAVACGPSVEPYPLSATQVQEVRSSLETTMLPDFTPVTDAEFKTICGNFENEGWDSDKTFGAIDQDNDRSVAAHMGLAVWLWEVTGESADATPGLLAGFCAHLG